MRTKRRFNEKEGLLYLAQIIVALEFLHKNKIVYRDLKPENVILDKRGHVKLADFGLSREDFGIEALSKSFVGSIAYLAPEILSKRGHTKSVDWYLCGVIYYNMIVGIPPFYDRNTNQLF